MGVTSRSNLKPSCSFSSAIMHETLVKSLHLFGPQSPRLYNKELRDTYVVQSHSQSCLCIKAAPPTPTSLPGAAWIPHISAAGPIQQTVSPAIPPLTSPIRCPPPAWLLELLPQHQFPCFCTHTCPETTPSPHPLNLNQPGATSPSRILPAQTERKGIWEALFLDVAIRTVGQTGRCRIETVAVNSGNWARKDYRSMT